MQKHHWLNLNPEFDNKNQNPEVENEDWQEKFNSDKNKTERKKENKRDGMVLSTDLGHELWL